MMEPFRHLLKPDTWAAGFQWTTELDRQFHLAKEKIIEAVKDGVKAFNPTRWTCLATDWIITLIWLNERYRIKMGLNAGLHQEG